MDGAGWRSVGLGRKWFELAGRSVQLSVDQWTWVNDLVLPFKLGKAFNASKSKLD